MNDKCRRYVADPNIECFRASRCDAIVYREKIFRLYRCRCNGVVQKILNFIGHLSASLVCILYTRFDPGWRGWRVKSSVLCTDLRVTAAVAASF